MRIWIRRAAPRPDRLAAASSDVFRRADLETDADQKNLLLLQAQDLAAQSALAQAYSFLQQVVGIIAVTLPIILLIGGGLFHEGWQGSISSYYYTHMGNYFVGSLFALGVFFLSYNYKPLDHYQWDNYLSDFASLMAFGVALFPTASNAQSASSGQHAVAIVHLACAATLFILLAVFALFRFTMTAQPPDPTAEKIKRDLVYRMCGWIIVGALIAIVVSEIAGWNFLFWGESIAVIAFGVAWLVKGGFLGILADR